ncbi:hypothetical protein GIB67_031453 [Kingdonia uniflora]|uniref:Glycoside hydrolase family 13 N-terminal domain-containing protein n=1 Tax=Kingdonia uniflora TaxID=39325 RepID=A0A7J7MB69_9MAGN|nr:hypothetical protein GIB67_031453 [Kingdonia uniflora]
MDALYYSQHGTKMLRNSPFCISKAKSSSIRLTSSKSVVFGSNKQTNISKARVTSAYDNCVRENDRGESRITSAYDRRAREAVIEEDVPEMSEVIPSFKVTPGQAYPLGASELERGVNFSLFSQHASAVTLCISIQERGEFEGVNAEMLELSLDPGINKTGDIWHISVGDLPQHGVLYGYCIDGPRGWHHGHRFDNNVILLDPYAKLVEGRRFFGDVSHKMSKFLGTYDFTSLPFNWGSNYKQPNIPEVN